MAIESAIKECVDGLTPRYFDGVRDKRRQKYPKFFRDVIFKEADRLTSKSKAYWRELTKDTPQFVPPVVCACDDFTYVNTSDQWVEKDITFPYMQLGASIDCDYIFTVRAEESEDGDRELGDAIEDSFLEEQEIVDDAFDIREDLWAAELALTGRAKIEGKGFKPYYIEFKRSKELEETLKGDQIWGKDSCANPFAHLDMMNNRMFCKGLGNTVTDIIMSQNTCDKMMASPLLQECMKGFNPRMFLPSVMGSSEISLEMKAPFQGAKLAFVMRGDNGVNVNIWCVRAFYDFKDPSTGQLVKCDLIKDGKVWGYDLSGGPTSYRAGYIYGGIKNMHAGRDRKRRRFARAYIPENGKSMKYTSESAALPIIRCPDASFCLTVCPEGK